MNSVTQNGRTTVAIVKCPDYSDEEAVYQSVKRLIDGLGGVSRFVNPGEKVLIKPNLLAGEEPHKAVTTHPTVVAAMVRLVKEAGGIPLTGDSPCIARFEAVAVSTGMADVAARYQARLVDLATGTDISITDGAILKRVTVAREALDADAIISISKLKTHNFTIFTGAVKNMFGVVPGLIKADYHLRMPQIEDFSKMLLDVYAAVPARLHVMDGIWAMEGDKGPRSGNPRRVGLLIAGTDGIAVDAVATSIVGIEPDSIPTTRIGHAERKGIGRIEEIRLVGDPLQEVRVSGFRGVRRPGGISKKLPPFLLHWLRKHISNKPKINPKACKLCMTCYKACPPKAISRQRGRKRLRIDYDKCIRCYCCLESCPYDAVDIRKGLLARLPF
jgi:uncharacterized protein (DUF362 family)/Pyruvate/2-oxoacid:ferredoxin oxidoreductase delta subunit